MEPALQRTHPDRETRARDLAIRIARTAEENRGRDVTILDLRGATALVDFFVIASGASRRQIRSIAGETDRMMKAEGEHKLGIEGYEAGRWVLLDYGDIVVHVFEEETRRFYDLEQIWADAPRMAWTTGP